RCHSLLCQIDLSAPKRGRDAREDGIRVSWTFREPRFGSLLGRRAVSTRHKEPLKGAGSCLRIRLQRQFVSLPGFLQSADVETNRGHPVMGTLELRPGSQDAIKCLDGFDVLKILRRAPENPRARQV